MIKSGLFWIAMATVLWCGWGAFGQTFNERFEDWPVDLKINGRVIVAGSLSDVAWLKPLLPRSTEPQKLLLIAPSDQQERLSEQYAGLFSEVVATAGVQDCSQHEDASVIAWHTPSNFQTNSNSLHHHQDIFDAFIQDGNTLIVVGGGAAWCSQRLIKGEELLPATELGFGLLPDCVLQPIPADSSADVELSRILSLLAVYPRCVGILLSPDTALVLSGRKVRVSGTGEATFVLAANARQPRRVERLEAREAGRRQQTTDWLLDLTAWRRDAIDRTLEPFPPAQPDKPVVDNGTLFIVGGGGLPEGLMHSFVEAAGGVEQAKLVYVPCSEAESISRRPGMLRVWEQMGVRTVSYIHTKDRQQADQDESFYEPLRKATGVWFGGGRQWNFADSYYGTTTHRLMKEVLRRGGAIGGSSAGASVQARYLARATPIENYRIMAPGYERGGLGFISGVAIDQHFSQRRRQPDMTRLVNRYPQLLGIGIDETTAIIVEKSMARVVGEGQVHFYDRKLPVVPDSPDFIALSAGETYDLEARQVITPDRPTKAKREDLSD